VRSLTVLPAGLWTAAGAGLAFLPPGSFGWWDPVWVLLLVFAAYAGLVSRGGLVSARICAGITLAVFLAATVLASASGHVLFGGPGFFKIGGVLALMPPLFAFSLLCICHGATGCLFPSLRPGWLAATTSVLFTATAFNGSGFLGVGRQWWLIAEDEVSPALVAALIVLVLLFAWGLALLQPADTRLHRSRWSPEAGLVLVMNALFIAAHLGGGGGR
jgi:hypothetical protein